MLQRLPRFLLRHLPIYNGAGWIVDRTFLSRVRFGEALLDVQTRDGYTLRVDPNDLVGRIVYYTGRFDRCVVDVLTDLASPGSTLWDIGANIGYVSCTFLHRVARSRCLSVEPLPDVSAILRHNLAQFGERAHAVEAAVSNVAGKGGLVRFEGNSGASHLAEEGSLRVPLVTGEELRVHSKPDLVKIDVEGHELAVLKGIASTLAEARPRAVAFEHHTWGAEFSVPILTLLGGLGYRVLKLGRKWSGWRLLELDDPASGYSASPDYVAVLDDVDWRSLGRDLLRPVS